ncbi:hypothetical protein KSC_104320 [Ktedonobacter sp. SOSP1-52]|nr:hypothetical protein KSC_104320 [Ktedonobacter sp. SOSP1-52]
MEDIWHNEGHNANFPLVGGQVGQREASTVVEERGGRREDLEIAGPAKTLIALWAVGWDIKEVAAHAPDDIFVQLVEHRL